MRIRKKEGEKKGGREKRRERKREGEKKGGWAKR